MRLTDCFIDLIAYVAYLMKSIDTRQLPFEQVKGDIQRRISECEVRFKEGGFSQEDYNLGRFAVFSWIDEMILSSRWNEKNRWQGDQLQLHYYNTTDAGELFFERLNNMGVHQKDVREVYYLCLAMGFMGRYCRKGDEFLLDQLKSSNLKLLSAGSIGIPSLDKGDLFPEAYPSDLGNQYSKGKRFEGFSWLVPVFAIAPIGLFISLYIIYRFILGNFAANLFQ